jgi:ketosteroid isomerase-like protein
MKPMTLPKVLADLVTAQNTANSSAYANCFSDTAIVFDEGKQHKGKAAIKSWIAKANQAYKTKMKPLEYSATKQILEAEISGTFPGSPLVLTYQFELNEGQIQSLKIV